MVGGVEPQRKNLLGDRQPPQAVAEKEPSAVDLYSALSKQAEDCKSVSSGIYPLSSERVASSDTRTAEQGDLYGDTVGCLCLSLYKGQTQTTDQLPSRVRM